MQDPLWRHRCLITLKAVYRLCIGNQLRPLNTLSYNVFFCSANENLLKNLNSLELGKMQVLTRVFFFPNVSVTLSNTVSAPFTSYSRSTRNRTTGASLFLFLTCGLYEEKPLTEIILKQVKRTKCYIPRGRLEQRYELRRKMCRHLHLQQIGLGSMSTLEPRVTL